jgi:hypothetical protein
MIQVSGVAYTSVGMECLTLGNHGWRLRWVRRHYDSNLNVVDIRSVGIPLGCVRLVEEDEHASLWTMDLGPTRLCGSPEFLCV